MHAKVFPRSVDKFRGGAMRQEFAKAVWARYKADSTDMRVVSFLAGKRGFLRILTTEPGSSFPEGIDDEVDISDVEGMVTLSGPRSK